MTRKTSLGVRLDAGRFPIVSVINCQDIIHLSVPNGKETSLGGKGFRFGAIGNLYLMCHCCWDYYFRPSRLSGKSLLVRATEPYMEYSLRVFVNLQCCLS